MMRTRGRRLVTAAAAAAVLLGATATQAATIVVSTDITTSETWTANNEYVLDLPVYVTNGATLTIEAGTVVRGQGPSGAGTNDPGTLIVARGSKIRALGTAQKPIVFTDLNDNNIGLNPGTPPYNNALNALSLTGRWGGVILLGRSYVANNTLAAPSAAREFQIEGLTADGGLGLYGNCAAVHGADPPPVSICDDDDSGSMSYVSIRYGGFNLSANNEINGLTLGGVGRATDLHHIEVFQNKDDLVEFFGGAANVKYFMGGNGGDDGIDFDEGWRGKVQFAFIMQGTPGTDKSDKGSEQDGGNSPDGSQPRAIPTIYNATLVGLGQKAYTNKAQNTALQFRDNAGGRWYNSFFADFGGAPLCIEGGTVTSTDANTSGQRSVTNYVPDGLLYQNPDSDLELELRNNQFWCFGNGGVVPTGDASAAGCVAGFIHHDNGTFSNAALGNNYLACASANPITTLTRTDSGDPNTPDPITLIDPTPAAASPLLTSPRTAPNDGFFEPVAFKGAFASNQNWARGWSTMDRLGYFPPKPTSLISTNITTSTTWTADTEYILDLPVYVSNGATLTIEPCTVIRGQGPSGAGTNDPGTLVVSRGSKIQAVGTPDCPITFTDLLDDNLGSEPGTPPYNNVTNAMSLTGRWGGVILLGRSYVANNTLAAPNAAREFQIEGLTAAGGLGLYGNCAAVHGDPPSPISICDDDDSGALKYISIRYGGFNVSANNEINGLTLGGVGRATDIDHIDIYQNKDDMIEFFGGAANVKYLSGVAGGDDGIDFDEGWRGKIQFAFMVQGTPGTDKSDKGSEQDGGNSPDGSQPRAIPTIYNATLVGLGQKAYTNKAQNTALQFRDNAGGRWYNSFFADFGGAPLCIEGGTVTSTDANTSGQRSVTNYVPDGLLYQNPDSDFELELQDNNFWCFGNGGVIPTGDASAAGCVAGFIHHDNGTFTNAALENAYFNCASPSLIRTLTRISSGDPNTPDPVVSIDPRAVSSGLKNNNTTNRKPPADGFFTPAAFKGGFRGSNWLGGWSTPARLGLIPTCAEDPDAVPDELEGLRFADKTTLLWDKLHTREPQVRQDVLRSTSPSNFGSASCVESDDFDTTALDATAPSSGQVFHYLLRAEASCGSGTLGYQSNGTERSGVSCGL
jgi:hypothetical protein